MVDRIVYVSGCLGLDKDSWTIVPGGSGCEMAQALKNMKAILEAAGSCIENVVKVTIFVGDLEDFPVINEEYRKGSNTFIISRLIGNDTIYVSK